MLDFSNVQEFNVALSKAKAFFRSVGVQEDVFEYIADYSLEYEVIICAHEHCLNKGVESYKCADVLAHYMSEWDV